MTASFKMDDISEDLAENGDNTEHTRFMEAANYHERPSVDSISAGGLSGMRDRDGRETQGPDRVNKRRKKQKVKKGSTAENQPLLSQQQQQANRTDEYTWDKPTVDPDDPEGTGFVKCSECMIKFLRVVMIIGLPVIVFLGTILAKTTVLIAASNVFPSTDRLYCITYNYTFSILNGTENVTETYAKCVRIADNYTVSTTGDSCLNPDSPSDTEVDDPLQEYRVCDAVSIRWIWCLTLILVSTEFFVFLRCFWAYCFKNEKWPSFTLFLEVLMLEGLQTIGLCIFVFRVLPKLPNIVHGVFLMTGVALLPSIFQLARGNVLSKLLNVVAILIQLSAVAFYPVYIALWNDSIDDELSYMAPIALVLMSTTLWFNYLRSKRTQKKVKGVATDEELHGMREEIQECRTGLYTIISLIKICLILVTMTFLYVLFDDFQLRELWDFSYDDNNCGNTIGVELVSDAEWDWIKIWVLNFFAAMLTYACARTAVKVQLQVGTYAVPLTFVTPMLVLGLCIITPVWQEDPCWISDVMPTYISWGLPTEILDWNDLSRIEVLLPLVLGLAWWLSQLWISFHIYRPDNDRLAKTKTIFYFPLWNGVILEQWLLHNRNRKDAKKKEEKEDFPMIYLCATMWHETEAEMSKMLKSILKLDKDHIRREALKNYLKKKNIDKEYYNFEGHIFFDGAIGPEDPKNPSDKNGTETWEDGKRVRVFKRKHIVNEFVTLLVSTMKKATREVYDFKATKPTKIHTPYGGRLEWTMPGGNKLVAHLKDNTKIRNKKRWSQVMYMYYFLTHKLSTAPNQQEKAENTYLLALDGDVDFEPKAVQLLVDHMKIDPDIAAACGRIHPKGIGPMVWYQKFEYAIGHWMQKATEHVIGSVLCSPGCFSMFKGNALLSTNVMKTYTKKAEQPSEVVQYDQGEDRWLCTLLLKRGWKVAYSAASDAYTFCPEKFEEFFKQRKRWAPSTMANIMDLLGDGLATVRKNNNISLLYILYQGFLFGASVIGPGTIFLMIVSAVEIAVGESLDSWASLIVNLVPILIYIIICYTAKSSIQIAVASVLTVLYAIVQMIVLVGIIIQIADEPCSPNAIFFYFVTASFILAGLLHPQECFNLIYGFIYFLSIPSMYMLLTIYAITNLNDVSWGTRESEVAPTTAKDKQNEELEKQAKKAAAKGNTTLQGILEMFKVSGQEEDGFAVGVGNIFRCLWCPKPRESATSTELRSVQVMIDGIKGEVEQVNRKMNAMARAEIVESDTEDPQTRRRKTTIVYPDLQPELSKEDSTASTESIVEKIDLNKEAWIDDPNLGNPGKKLKEEEERFFDQLIEKYLSPIVEDPDSDETKKKKKKLRELRNQMSFGYFLLNAIFIVFIFTMQENVERVAITWPCQTNEDKVYLEPIGLTFLCVYGVIIVLQVLGMLAHRSETFLHLISTTVLGNPCSSQCCGGNKKNTKGKKNKPITKDNIEDLMEYLSTRLKVKQTLGKNWTEENTDKEKRRRMSVAVNENKVKRDEEQADKSWNLKNELDELLKNPPTYEQHEKEVNELESRGYISDVNRRKSMAGFGVLKSFKVEEAVQGQDNPSFEPDSPDLAQRPPQRSQSRDLDQTSPKVRYTEENETSSDDSKQTTPKSNHKKDSATVIEVRHDSQFKQERPRSFLDSQRASIDNPRISRDQHKTSIDHQRASIDQQTQPHHTMRKVPERRQESSESSSSDSEEEKRKPLKVVIAPKPVPKPQPAVKKSPEIIPSNPTPMTSNEFKTPTKSSTKVLTRKSSSSSSSSSSSDKVTDGPSKPEVEKVTAPRDISVSFSTPAQNVNAHVPSSPPPSPPTLPPSPTRSGLSSILKSSSLKKPWKEYPSEQKGIKLVRMASKDDDNKVKRTLSDLSVKDEKM